MLVSVPTKHVLAKRKEKSKLQDFQRSLERAVCLSRVECTSPRWTLRMLRDDCGWQKEWKTGAVPDTYTASHAPLQARPFASERPFPGSWSPACGVLRRCGITLKARGTGNADMLHSRSWVRYYGALAARHGPWHGGGLLIFSRNAPRPDVGQSKAEWAAGSRVVSLYLLFYF